MTSKEPKAGDGEKSMPEIEKRFVENPPKDT
jgi:hypothetical protein